MRVFCPICHSRDLIQFAIESNRDILICHHCRHVFFKDMPSDSELTEYYKAVYTDSYGQIEIQKSNVSYYEAHFKELTAYVGGNPSIDVLDYGCSYPEFLIVAKKTGARVLGCDYSDEAAAYGKRNDIEVVLPRNLHTVTQKFDIVRFSHCLEHLVDPAIALKQARDALKPRGIIYITQPLFPIFKCTGFDKKIKDADYPTHLHFFTPLSFVEIAKKAGLELIKIFSHHNTEASFQEYGALVDYPKAVEGLSYLKDRGDNYFGFLNNYPFYMGENVVALMSIKEAKRYF